MRFWNKEWLEGHEIYFKTIYGLVVGAAAAATGAAAVTISVVQLSDSRTFAAHAQELAKQQNRLIEAQLRLDAEEQAPVLELAELNVGFNPVPGPRLSLAILNTNRPVTDVRARVVQVVEVLDHRGDVESRVYLGESQERKETFGGEEEIRLIHFTPGGHSLLSINAQADGVFDGRNNRTLRGKVYIELEYRDASTELRTKYFYYDLRSDRILPTFSVPKADGSVDVNSLYASEKPGRWPLVETAFRPYSPYLEIGPTPERRDPVVHQHLEPLPPEPPEESP